MPNLLMVIALAIGLGLFASFVRGSLIRGHARRRLQAPLGGMVDEAARPAPGPPVSQAAGTVFRRYRVIPWILAIVVGLTFYFGLHFLLIYSFSTALIVGLLGAQIETYFADRKKAIIEQQLADSLDLMIAALRAGASVVTSMERAAEETRPPLRPELFDALGLIRYGEDPRGVMRRLMNRVPIESFRLFTTTLSVHFEVGGSLAPTLAVVGRIVRDRIEIARRVRSLTAQARISTVALIVMTYLVALLMWQHDKENVRAFATSSVGSIVVAGSMLLQAVGIVWQTYMSKLRI